MEAKGARSAGSAPPQNAENDAENLWQSILRDSHKFSSQGGEEGEGKRPAQDSDKPTHRQTLLLIGEGDALIESLLALPCVSLHVKTGKGSSPSSSDSELHNTLQMLRYAHAEIRNHPSLPALALDIFTLSNVAQMTLIPTLFGGKVTMTSVQRDAATEDSKDSTGSTVDTGPSASTTTAQPSSPSSTAKDKGKDTLPQALPCFDPPVQAGLDLSVQFEDGEAAAASVGRTLVVFCGSLARPWACTRHIYVLLHCFHRVMQAVLAALPPQLAAQLQRRVARACQYYAAPHQGSQAMSAPDDPTSDLAWQEAMGAGVPLTPDCPVFNLGVPGICVYSHLHVLREWLTIARRGSQALNTCLQVLKDGQHFRLDALVRRVRILGMMFGCELVFVGEGSSVEAWGAGSESSPQEGEAKGDSAGSDGDSLPPDDAKTDTAPEAPEEQKEEPPATVEKAQDGDAIGFRYYPRGPNVSLGTRAASLVLFRLLCGSTVFSPLQSRTQSRQAPPGPPVMRLSDGMVLPRALLLPFKPVDRCYVPQGEGTQAADELFIPVGRDKMSVLNGTIESESGVTTTHVQTEESRVEEWNDQTPLTHVFALRPESAEVFGDDLESRYVPFEQQKARLPATWEKPRFYSADHELYFGKLRARQRTKVGVGAPPDSEQKAAGHDDAGVEEDAEPTDPEEALDLPVTRKKQLVDSFFRTLMD